MKIPEGVQFDPADIPPLETRTEVVWDVGVSLQRSEPAGDSIVSLMPTRVRGTTKQLTGKVETFDSDDPKDPVTSTLLLRGIRVRLSPRGRVLEAARPEPSPADQLGPDVRVALLRLGNDMSRPFAEQFFHELPEPAPRKSLAWEQSRALAPEWTFWERKSGLTGSWLGDATEKSVVATVAPDAVTATLRANGKNPRPAKPEPLDVTKLTPADLSDLGEQLDEWLVLGEVRIRRDTGLVASRTASYTLHSHWNVVKFESDKARPAPGGAPGHAPEDGKPAVSERTHEITLQLDLVDVR